MKVLLDNTYLLILTNCKNIKPKRNKKIKYENS